MRALLPITAALLLCHADWTLAAACHMRSGAASVPLVELYTSEGCSSCPPAERWLSSQFPPQRAEHSPAVLAFHVDYWDDSGWPDRYSSRNYTLRQQRVAAANHSTFTFTPQVVLQGHNAGGWSSGAFAGDLARSAALPPAATIDVAVMPTATGYTVTADALVPDQARRNGTALYVAFTDSGHDIDVRAGENRGERLHHDHVVRALSTATDVDAGGQARIETTFKRPADAGSAPTVIAFVQDITRGTVLQSAVLPLAACGIAP